MKKNNVRDLCREHPFIRTVLETLSGTDLNGFVRRKLEYISFPSFDRLDLKVEKTVLTKTDTNTKSYNHIDYRLIHHIGLVECRGDRMTHVTPEVGDGSIDAHIEQTNTWHKNSEHYKKKMVWDWVMKLNITGNKDGIIRMHIELYRFPDFWRRDEVAQTSLVVL